MIKLEKLIPDSNEAKKHLCSIRNSFGKYSTAYAVTNENLRILPHIMPKDLENVLTVAASGDHPMFCKLYGAKNVDTFDLSYNAKVVMDIKTAALSVLKYDEYCKLLSDLYLSKDITTIENIPAILKKLPSSECNYIKEMRGYRLFGHGLQPTYYSWHPVPYEAEFNKMQQVISTSFDFIWTDITTLHTNLTKGYDFIHLSNIFDYISIPKSAQILYSLAGYSEPGCNICFEMFFYNQINDLFKNFTKIMKKNKNSHQEWKLYTTNLNKALFILRRVH